MYNLSRGEALLLMQKGYKITHKYFSDEEYFYMEGPFIMSEDGFDFTELFYVRAMYKEGWAIKE